MRSLTLPKDWKTRQPAYHGPCLSRCGRPGGGRSGYCRQCNRVRVDRRTRLMRKLCAVLGGEAMPLSWIVEGIERDPQAREAARRILSAIDEGKLSIAYVRYPVWLWPRA